MKYSIAGSTARTAAELANIHRNTAIRFFYKIREKITLKQQERANYFCGRIELDESYFGDVKKGKRACGSAGKIEVFGFLKRGGKVYTQIILDSKKDTLMPIIHQKFTPIHFAPTIHSMCLNSNTIVSIIANDLPIDTTIFFSNTLPILDENWSRQR